MMRSIYALTLLIAVGCRTLPGSDGSESLVILEESTGTAIAVGALLTHPEETGTRTYRISGGDHDDRLVHRETTPTDQFNADWITVESIVTDDGPIPRRTEYWSINSAGDAVLHATVDHEEHAMTLFKPPLVTMPAELKPGNTKTFDADVRIVEEDDIKRRKESGTATQAIAYTGSVRMRTTRGEVDAAKIVIEFEADLALADAIERTVRYVTAENGIVAIQRTRTVKILGMGGTEHSETLQLVRTK